MPFLLVLGALVGPADASAAVSVTVVPLNSADTFTYPFEPFIERSFLVTNTGTTTEDFILNAHILNDAGVAQGALFQTPIGGPRALELAPGAHTVLLLKLGFGEVAAGGLSAWHTGQHIETPITIELDVPANIGPPQPVFTHTFANHIVVALNPVDPNGMQTNATIAGVVRDAATGKPLDGVQVQALSPQGSFHDTRTSKGAYSLPAFAWKRQYLGTDIEYTVLAQAPGYLAQSRIVVPHAGQSAKLDFALRKVVTSASYSVATKYETSLPVYNGSLSSDGRFLATAPFHSALDPGYIAQHAHVNFFDTSTGDHLWSYPLGGEVTGLDVSDDGSLVATYRPSDGPNPSGGSILVLDHSGALVHEYAITHTSYDLMQVAISHDKQTLAYGTLDGRLGLLDLATGDLLWQADAGGGQIRVIRFDADGSTIYAASGDGNVYAFDAGTGDLRWRTYIGSWSTHLALSTHYVLAGGKADDAIYLLDKETGAVVWSYPVDSKPDNLVISPDESRFVYCNSAEGTLKLAVFDDTGKLVWGDSLAGCRAATISPDGRYLVATDGKDVRLYLLATGERIWSGATNDPQAPFAAGDGFAWMSPDDSRIVMGTADDGHVYFWTGAIRHARSVSVSVRGKRARGHVTVPDGYAACAAGSVTIERRSGRWKPVAHTTAGANGRFTATLKKKAKGRYRARVAQSTATGHVCLAAISR